MASKTREQRAVQAVACPDCGAKQGELCRRPVMCWHCKPVEKPGKYRIVQTGERFCLRHVVQAIAGNLYPDQFTYVHDPAYEPQTQMGRPIVCSGRRTAWQMVRDGEVA